MGRGRPPKCPYCSASTSVAKGFRRNHSGTVRLRLCKECGRRWTLGTKSKQKDNSIMKLDRADASPQEESPNQYDPGKKELKKPAHSKEECDPVLSFEF